MTSWIVWNGGLAPVPPEIWVEVELRDGERAADLVRNLSWVHAGADTDIVAYRMIDRDRITDNDLPVRAEFLDEAKRIICKDRQDMYGRPENTFHLISEYWTCYLAHPISPADVALMMALLKIARLQKNPLHVDGIIDTIGYAALAGELLGLSIDKGNNHGISKEVEE